MNFHVRSSGSRDHGLHLFRRVSLANRRGGVVPGKAAAVEWPTGIHQRQMQGATLLKTSEFGRAVVENV